MRCVRDTASVCMSCTTGLHVVSSLRRSARRIRPMRSRSMTMWIDACENGLQTRAIFTRHPKRELHEVHYARCIAALEDKIVQRATAAVLNAIYEEDFLGFSYGFRPKRSQHDALDALVVGTTSKKVNFILDADIQGFFDAVGQSWLIRFVEHRIADPRIIRLIQKWLKAGVLEDGVVTVSEKGTGQGSVASPLLANVYLHYVFELWARAGLCLLWRRFRPHPSCANI